MALGKLSLRHSIFAVISSLALLAIAALFISSSLYERFVYDIERNAARNLVALKVDDLHRQLTKYSSELGLTLQSNKDFRAAFRSGRYQALGPYLNDNFHQYYVTAGVIRLIKIYVLDHDYNFVTESTDGMKVGSLAQPVCGDLAKKAQQRTGAARLKATSGLCTFGEGSYHAVIVPIGTLSPIGYVQVVVDPTYNVPEIALDLAMPVRVRRADDSVVFTPRDWPFEDNSRDFLFARYEVNADQGDVAYVVEAAENIAKFRAAFRSTTLIVLLIAALLMATGLVITVFISRRSLVALQRLSDAATQTSEGQYREIEQSGYHELDNVITSYNNMVNRVKSSQERLEDDVRTATRKLRTALGEVEKRNQELESAIRLAEQASTAKSAFLANMSHELRTPLNAVIGYSEMLNDDLTGTDFSYLVDDVDKINDAGKHLLEIVNNILDLSKIEAGKMDLKLANWDLKKIIEEVVATVIPFAQASNTEISLTLGGEPASAYTDGIHVKQVVLNLLNNAVKFAEGGHVRVTMQRDEYLGNPVYLISVSDDGIGIKQEDISKLFQPFQQADNSSTRRFGGTGLGLALSRQLCEGLGGHISVTSEAGKGATFVVRLPVSTENKSAVA